MNQTGDKLVMKKIKGYDVYSVHCPSCLRSFEGRLFYPPMWLGTGRYCDKCSNLMLSSTEGGTSPTLSKCNGEFDSTDLLCPACGKVVYDVEKQLASQFYLVQPAANEDHPTSDEIETWYTERKQEGFLTGKELFIQLDQVLYFDEESMIWRYFEKFEH